MVPCVLKVIVGHTDIVHGVLTCLFVGGHALLEGVPGLGKTLLVRTLSEVLDIAFVPTAPGEGGFTHLVKTPVKTLGSRSENE